ncbi:glycine betaine ABC transporter substrate-binding protein [Vreelandella gomseomensis]|uniref:Glycine betaine ABC transporter substrate-binding protein n=1 Tax=Vreelandella gomseomensis TaxID=370766 RepID=A0ABU1GGQ3_9GAMM|nr:glycine betaine ABC transporter substrate-binding protein [Halomonas gomseomensis]MDR5876635.1 glycine betaine ABC transporter substrate-binding protein [Halomonas gomseomensis]
MHRPDIHRTALLATLALTSLLPFTTQAAQDASDELRLVVPPWPGVTVKSEILAQIAEPLGYQVEALEVSSTVGYQTLQSGESDAFLAGWLPSQQKSYDASMETDSIIDLGNNVTGARMGFAVPGYAYEAGVTNAEQLADPEIRERFGAEIYSIESGSTVSDHLHEAAEADTYGLSQWDLRESSTPSMLAEVDAAKREQRWILFYGWTPHWMAPAYDMEILDDPASVFGENNGQSDVRTIVAHAYHSANPNMIRLLDQYELTAAEQSEFIRDFGLDEGELETVARDWLLANPERIETFLEGVTTRDGEPGLAAVRASLE